MISFPSPFFNRSANHCRRVLCAQQRRLSSSFLTDPASATLQSPYQFYTSLSTDPFVNLSLEHYLVQKTPPTSAILLLYINRPCVVIGRNQNPWVEVNFPKCRNSDGHHSPSPSQSSAGCDIGPIDFLRRRSGGGAVFHDEGNLNFSVISPKADFTRNKHAEMVVRALRRSYVRGDVRVNERHDIVLDVPPSVPSDLDTSPTETLKISGSAYRLTGSRALHHGTCLLASPNLHDISGILRAPARDYILAKGVESVRSKVGNVSSYIPDAERGVLMEGVRGRILEEFRIEYGLSHVSSSSIENEGFKCVTEDECLAVDDIKKGIAELKSTAWRYNQTPQFTFSTHPTADDPRTRPPLPPGLPQATNITLTIKSGAIRSAKICTSSDPVTAQQQSDLLERVLLGRAVCEVTDWRDLLVLSRAFDGAQEEGERLGEWMNEMLAVV